MIELDSHSTKSPSTITGTIAFGLSARNSAVSVGRNPKPQSSCSKDSPSSAQVHSTLRTLMDDVLPSIWSMVVVSEVVTMAGKPRDNNWRIQKKRVTRRGARMSRSFVGRLKRRLLADHVIQRLRGRRELRALARDQNQRA